MGHPSELSLQQAGERADRYAADTIAHLPGQPTLTNKSRTSLDCEDGSVGRVDLGDKYDLAFAQPADNSAVFAQAYKYWTSQHYRILTDTHTRPSLRDLVIENPHDGFRVGLREGAVGNLFMTVSSPCVLVTRSP